MIKELDDLTYAQKLRDEEYKDVMLNIWLDEQEEIREYLER